MRSVLLKIIVISLFVTPVIAVENSIKVDVNQKKSTIGIIFLGDTGDINKNRDKVAIAIENFCKVELCSIGLLLGDNMYQVGVKDINDPQFNTKFEKPYGNLQFKFYPVLGNHDVLGNWQAEVDYSSEHWQMGGRYYCINAGLVELYALDTNLYLSYNKNQHDWLCTEIPKKQATWKIVYGHHPVFSNGSHGDTEQMLIMVKPVLEENKIDFYISGHDHDKELIEDVDIKYIIMGTGSTLRPVQGGKNTVFAKSSFGFGHLLLTPKAAVLRFINENGDVEFEKTYQK